MEIWKYKLEVKNTQILSVPAKAKVLTVQSIRARPWIYVLVNPIQDRVKRTIRMYEEGDLIKGGKYIGTHKDRGDIFIYHIFDDGED